MSPKRKAKPKARKRARSPRRPPKPKTKARKKPGPKPKVASIEVVDALIDALSGANTIETACNLVGMSPATYYRAIETGEEDIKAGRSTVFREFCEKTTRARAKVQSFVAGSILKAVADDWHAGVFMLTHGPEKSAWAEKSKLEISGDRDSPLRIETNPVSIDEWMAKYHEAVDAAAAEPEDGGNVAGDSEGQKGGE